MATSNQTSNSIAAQAAALSLTGERSVEVQDRKLLRRRQAIVAIMAFLLLLIGARLWCLEGLLFPVRIAGPSMAETHRGLHFQVKCADCGHLFHCDGEQAPQSLEATCPNCGYSQNKLQQSDLQIAEQVLIDHWLYLLDRPARNDVIAIQDPDDKSKRLVKRVVGLPGEQIAIRRGDVIVDGQPVAKSLAQLKSQAILVYDNRLPPRKSTDLPLRWQPAEAGSHWVEREQAFIFSGKVPPQGKDFDWLSFRYVRRLASPSPHSEYSAVLDFDSYNQAQNRNLNDVSDLLLTCRASVAKYGCLVFAAVDGADRFEVHMCHDEQKLKLFQNGKELKIELLPHRNHDEPIDIEFALCDQRVLFGMDGREVLRQAYTRGKTNVPQTEPQLQIGGAGARIRISQARVFRDIYYLEPLNTARPWHAERPIPANHYLVLGDNPPVSIDSRQWPQAEVPLSAIRGRVIRPWWASR